MFASFFYARDFAMIVEKTQVENVPKMPNNQIVEKSDDSFIGSARPFAPSSQSRFRA